MTYALTAILFFYFFISFEYTYGGRIIYPDDIILTKLRSSTTAAPITITIRPPPALNWVENKSPNQFGNFRPPPPVQATEVPAIYKFDATESNYTPPPSTHRPWKHRNCVWCCDNTGAAEKETNEIQFIDIPFNDLPLCTKCCAYQPKEAEDYDTTEDDDDKLGKIAVATILG